MMMELKRLYGLWQKMLLRLSFGYDWNKRILDKVPDEWKVFSGYPNVYVLSEQGLYFFLARSDKPRFRFRNGLQERRFFHPS